MIPVASRTAAVALGLAAAAVPLVYLPDVLPPLFGIHPAPHLFPPIFEFTLLPRLFLLQLLLLAGLVGWGLAAFRKPPATLCRNSIILPILLYMGFSLLSVSWAVNPVEGVVQAGRLFTFLVLALIAAHALSPAAIRAVCAAGAAAGAAVSCIGIAQYFGWGFADIPTVGNPGATFGYRNFAASYLVIGIPIAAAFAWTSPARLTQAAWSLSAALMALFLIYTRTRGAWVGLAGALLAGVCFLVYLRIRRGSDLLGLRRSRFRLQVAALGLLIVLMGALLPHRMRQEGKFYFDERKTDVATTLAKTFSPADARGRLTVWRHTLEMIRDNPLFGVGLGSWQYVYPRYDRGDRITDNAAPQRPHNDLLWILSETGIAGLGAYLWILVALCAAVYRLARRSPERPETLWAVGIGIGILALVGHGLFSFPKERIAPSLTFWMGLGFVARLATERAPRRPDLRRPDFLFGSALALAGALLLCALTLTYRHIRFDAPYLQALTAWRRQDWPEVASQTAEALRWGPLNHRALLLNGLAHYNQGDPEGAVRAYTAALRYHPNAGHAALAAACADLGRYGPAAEHYRLESRLFPASPHATLDLARALAFAGQWAEAADAYGEAAEKAREVPLLRLEARLGLADACRRLGRREQAADIYREILAVSPDSADIYDTDGVLSAYRKALQSAPEDPRSHNNLGALLARQGRFAEAESAYLQALRLRSDYARAYHNLGDLYVAMGDTLRAVEAYARFLREWRGDARFLDAVRRRIRDLKGGP